jgi:hypothetical protein
MISFLLTYQREYCQTLLIEYNHTTILFDCSHWCGKYICNLLLVIILWVASNGSLFHYVLLFLFELEEYLLVYENLECVIFYYTSIFDWH